MSNSKVKPTHRLSVELHVPTDHKPSRLVHALGETCSKHTHVQSPLRVQVHHRSGRRPRHFLLGPSKALLPRSSTGPLPPFDETLGCSVRGLLGVNGRDPAGEIPSFKLLCADQMRVVSLQEPLGDPSLLEERTGRLGECDLSSMRRFRGRSLPDVESVGWIPRLYHQLYPLRAL